VGRVAVARRALGVVRGALSRRALGVRRGVSQPLDAHVGRPRIGLACGQREVVRGVAQDLEVAGHGPDADRADLVARDAAAPADQREQPARLCFLVAADVDPEQHGAAREVGA
jgi:hypothetical protein